MINRYRKKFTSSICPAVALAALACVPCAPARAADPAGDAGQAAAQQQQVKQRNEDIASYAVAERLVAIAQANLAGPLEPDTLRQSAALLDAATRLFPNEPRYYQLLAEVYAQLHDVPDEIKTWEQYRKPTRAPDDRVAQIRLIDLYATEMQTADAREKYFASLLDRASISDEVKSHVATEAARLLLNRSKTDAAAMVDRAVKFYPLPEAVLLQYQLLDSKAPAVKQLVALLALVKADPTESDALDTVAELLSHHGLPAEAKGFYSAAVETLRRQGVAPQHELLLDYAASLYLSGDDKLAEAWADGVLSATPNDVDFQFLKLTVLKKGTDGTVPDAALSAAGDALANRWVKVNDVILGLSDQPAGAEGGAQPVVPPDPQEAAARLAQLPASPQNQRLKDAFLSAMVDLAWLDLYYANKPDDARHWIDAIKSVAAPGSPALERLEGWYSLKTQKPEQAAQHFNAIKGKDVLSELGLIAVAHTGGTPQTLAITNGLRAELLSLNYGGLLGAIIHQALQSDIPPPPPPDLPQPIAPAPASQPTTQPTEGQSPDAQAMSDAVKQFPAPLLTLASQPEKFYALHIAPTTGSYRYAQPIMAVVSLSNSGTTDLPITTLGPLQPIIISGAGAMEANLPPARAMSQLFGRLVLRPGEEIQQIVRLDQGALGDYLGQTITPGLILITGDVYTNPMMGKSDDPADGGAKVQPGAGGQKASTSLIGRKVPDLLATDARAQFYKDLQNGGPDVRIESLDLLSANARWLHRQHAQDPDSQRQAHEFITVIDRYSADPVTQVADWARYLSASANRPDGEQLIKALMVDKDWLARLLSVLAMRNEPFAIRRMMTAKLTSDGDATVKTLADATLRRLSAAATQPAAPGADAASTQPAALPESP